MRILFALAALILSAVPTTAQDQEDWVAEGKALAEASCARCHAIGTEGESTHETAPPFRTLSERYPVGDLEEALVEGIVSGHEDMPEFVFAPEEAEALIAYMQSVQPD